GPRAMTEGSVAHLESLTKRFSAPGESGLQASGAVAIAARPRFFAVHIAAAAPRVSVLDLGEVEISLPVLALFGQGRRAIADLHPLHAPGLINAGLVHVAEVLAA